MSFIYKNPLSTDIVNGTLSVIRTDTKGTTFSSGLVGGYTEVWGLSDLKFTIIGTGNIRQEANRIPVEYYQRPAPFQSNQLTLNNDLISSGRRRLGQLVYVQETDTVYQYVINDYETLYDDAFTDGAISTGDTSSTVSSGSQFAPNIAGTNFINAWLDSSIEGVSGVTRANARWKIFYGTDITVTGGTYSNGTAVFSNSTGGTFNVTGFTSGGTGTDTFLTGGTYNNSTGTLSLERNDSGSTINITGFTTGATEDTYVTGVTYNQLTKELTLGLNDGVDFNATGFAAEVTGGTYSGGSITLYKNDGTTSLITGLEILTHIGLVNDSNISVSGATIDFVDTTTYKGAFFDYVIDDGTNYRAGTVQSVWSSTDIQFNDSSTVDIGTTNNFSWGMELDGNNALLKANILGGTWNIRIIKHII
jgi:hypothetical protein|tara:strand:- start:4764 stop:6020 length:1257 start_codon:yes stop_codon:yes gene_type:complete